MNRSRDDFLISTQSGQEKESSNDDECEISSQTIVIRDEPHETSCLCISVYSAVVIALVCVFLVLGRDYIKYVLLSLEETNLCISFAIFSFLFTVVSFPMTWGYILLNIAAGYLYGLLLGLVVVMVCALFGISLAHLVIKNCLRSFVLRRLTNDSIRSIMRVVDSDNGIKVVVLSRLTPIPFGLQNSLYAVSSFSVCINFLFILFLMYCCCIILKFCFASFTDIEFIILTLYQCLSIRHVAITRHACLHGIYITVDGGGY